MRAYLFSAAFVAALAATAVTPDRASAQIVYSQAVPVVVNEFDSLPHYPAPNYRLPNYRLPNYRLPNYRLPNYKVGFHRSYRYVTPYYSGWNYGWSTPYSSGSYGWTTISPY